LPKIVQNAKFRDFVRFSSKTNLLRRYVHWLQMTHKHNDHYYYYYYYYY